MSDSVIDPRHEENDAMQKRRLGKGGLEVSTLGFGCRGLSSGSC